VITAKGHVLTSERYVDSEAVEDRARHRHHFYEQLRNGRPAPSYDRSENTGVTVVIPGGEANLDFVRLLVTETKNGSKLGLDELLILNSLWHERDVVTRDAARLTQKSEVDTRAALQRLVEAGLVEVRGQTRARTWHLSAAAYRALGAKAAYVRQRGFEPLQRRQIVLQYIEKNECITRNETADMCRISVHMAYRLLDELVAAGLLVRKGTRGRSVSYCKKPT